MFFNLVFQNSKQNRKENGLFFSSLVVSIVAFYIILSISKQDVMIFLAKMESDAVSRLLQMIPVFYVMTLRILFCLIYFACKYQLQRRSHEFGVYLIMGMRRGKLFSLLLEEDMMMISVKHKMQGTILSIRDNGVGVKSYDLPYIFPKDFTGDTTDSQKKATGMGLYLTKKMADDLMLSIDAKSEWGKGGELMIVFPEV